MNQTVFFRMSIEIEEKDVVTTEFPICSVEYDEKNKFIYSGAYELLDGATRFFKNIFCPKSNAPWKDKVGCAFPMIILSEFRTRQYRDNDHREDALHFIKLPFLNSQTQFSLVSSNRQFYFLFEARWTLFPTGKFPPITDPYVPIINAILINGGASFQSSRNSRVRNGVLNANFPFGIKWKPLLRRHLMIFWSVIWN